MFCRVLIRSKQMMINSVSNLHITAGLSSLSRCSDRLRLQEEVTASPQEAAVPSHVIWMVPTFPSAVSKLMTRFHPSVVGKPKLSFCDSVQRLISKLLLLHPVKHREALCASSWSSHWRWKWSSRLFCSSHHTNIICTSAALLPVSISISFYFPGFLLSSAL